jgi:hypothetical protein
MRRRTVAAVVVALLCGVPAQLSVASYADSVTSVGNSFVGGALAAPSTPAASASSGNIKVTWVATATTWASGYQLLRATAASGPFAQIAQVTPRTTVSYTDTGVTPGVTYYYKLHSYYGGWVSPDTAVVSATGAVTVRVGNSTLQATQDSVAAGTAKAFLYTASSGGSSAHLNVYLDSTSTATTVVVALYSNSAGNPLTLLGQAALASPVSGAWNTVVITAIAITNGTKYWLAVLAPNGAGPVVLRDSAAGAAGSSQTSSQSNLSTLPASWSAGAGSANSPMSAYASP